MTRFRHAAPAFPRLHAAPAPIEAEAEGIHIFVAGGARGFDPVSRVHIVAGVMGYGSALLWFSLILAGALQAQLIVARGVKEADCHGVGYRCCGRARWSACRAAPPG